MLHAEPISAGQFTLSQDRRKASCSCFLDEDEDEDDDEEIFRLSSDYTAIRTITHY